MPHVLTYDISLKTKGHDEDVTYAFNPILEKNIRRGNTIIEVFDKHNYEVLRGTYMVRRGLMKFFDLKLDYLNPSDELDDENYNLKNYILAGAYHAISNGSKVEVLKSLKANGENVQISYCKAIDSWIIASKNVALVAKTRDDLSSYEG